MLLVNLVFAQTKIEFYNNTSKEIFAAYAYYDNSEKCWISVGWYSVPAYGSKIVDIGNITGTIYTRGRAGLLKEWGAGDAYFYTDPYNAFKKLFADKSSSGTRHAFSKMTVSKGVNKRIFN